MESAEVPGSGGSNWTDQETLLLLEALEIFKGKEWGEIAEHVATKTKEQCMLYFLQMPISEPFLDGEDFNETPQKITEQDSEISPSDVPDEMDCSGVKFIRKMASVVVTWRPTVASADWGSGDGGGARTGRPGRQEPRHRARRRRIARLGSAGGLGPSATSGVRRLPEAQKRRPRELGRPMDQTV